MTISLLFATESGNAEFIADALAQTLGAHDTTTLHDLGAVDPSSLRSEDLHLLICSTHGEGEVPSGAAPFAAALAHRKPELRGIRYAMFGLGDSSYEHYARGSEIIDGLLRDCGAMRIGPYGRHDASSQTDPIALAQAWAGEVLKDLETHAMSTSPA